MKTILPTDANYTPLYGYDLDEDVVKHGNLVWDDDSWSWVKMTQPVIKADSLNVTISDLLNVAIASAATLDVLVANFPETQDVAIASAATLDVNVLNFPSAQAVTGPLTNAELRAAEILVSDPAIERLLTLILRAALYPGWLDRTANQIRAQVTGSMTTVTTVTTVTNIGASFPGDMLQRINNINAWSNIQRRSIS